MPPTRLQMLYKSLARAYSYISFASKHSVLMLTPSYSYTYTYSYANVLTVTDPKYAYIRTTLFALSRITPY